MAGFYSSQVIPGIVLAAGKSSRMGRTKALLPAGDGDTFLSRVVRTLREGGVDDVVIVVGADAGAIRAAIDRDKMPVRVVENPGYEQGQLSSLIAALRIVDRPGVRAALVTLIDVPLIAATTVRTLLDEYRTGSALIVRPVSRARHGHPVIFDRALFDELRRANPKEGAKEVVRRYSAERLNVAIDDEGAFTDIDTPEDYERWIGPLHE
jgi:molybdenum cofactor cytidylyltransferase